MWWRLKSQCGREVQPRGSINHMQHIHHSLPRKWSWCMYGREETVQVALFDSHLFICYESNANALTAKCTDIWKRTIRYWILCDSNISNIYISWPRPWLTFQMSSWIAGYNERGSPLQCIVLKVYMHTCRHCIYAASLWSIYTIFFKNTV